MDINILEQGSGIVTPEIISLETSTIALKSDGTVWAWGQNNFGQLGQGNTANSDYPVQVKNPAGTGYLTNIVQIKGGINHVVALSLDGTVYTWGLNSNGQLGNNTLINSTLPIKVEGLNNVRSIGAASGSSFAVMADGTVWGWGYNANGNLGDGTRVQRNTPFKTLYTNVVQIEGGVNFSLALRADGTVWAAGRNYYGEIGSGGFATNVDYQNNTPVQVRGPNNVGMLQNIVKIAAGHNDAMALDKDGYVYAWGYGNYGGNGQGNTNNYGYPMQVKGGAQGTAYLQDIVDIGKLYPSNMAIDKDGNVYTWGYNANGNLGDGTTTNRTLPVKIMSNINTLPMTDNTRGQTSFVLTSDGAIYAWGQNNQGQTGNGSNVNQLTPQEIFATYLAPEKRMEILKIGQSAEIEVHPITPFNIANTVTVLGKLQYSSLNEDVATVDGNGNITAVRKRRNKNTYNRYKNRAADNGSCRCYIRCKWSSCYADDIRSRYTYCYIKRRRHSMDSRSKQLWTAGNREYD